MSGGNRPGPSLSTFAYAMCVDIGGAEGDLVRMEHPDEILYDGRYIQMVARSGWEYVRRKNTSGVVIIVALTPDDELILVEQYRVPVGASVIELPAGLAGDVSGREGEALAEAASRELEEETGFRAGAFEELTAGPVSSGLSSETVTFFRARDLTRVGAGGGDESESIVVHLVPLEEVPAWLAERRRQGRLVDPKVYSALFFAAGT